MSKFFATVLRIIDGDTFVSRVDLSPFASGCFEPHVRILGIQAAELHKGSDEDRISARLAQAWLTARIAGRDVVLNTVREDNFGRLLAEVSLDGVDIGAEMLEAGLAVPFRR